MNKNRLETDIVVVGGGSAGIATAIAAARNGSQVLLLEKSPQFGGKATSAVVGTICGAHYRSSEPNSRYVTQGFTREFCEQLIKVGASKAIHHYQGNLHFLPYNPIDFALAADQLIQAEPNIKRYYHASVTGAEVKDGRISALHFMNYREPSTVIGQQYIDCTGESTLSILCGLETYKQEHYQASAVVFSLENIKAADPAQMSLAVMRGIRKAATAGELPNSFEMVSVVPGSIRSSTLMLKIALPLHIHDGPENKSEAEQLGREAVNMVSKALIKHVSYFQEAHKGFAAAEVGTRTGQLSVGKEMLQKQDVLSCQKKANGIARGAWPIEFWEPGEKVKLQFFEEDDHYEIPAGCLISASLENLYFAGRIISADEEAIASARVIGTCLSTGFAAGTMASFAQQGKSHEAALKYIREKQVHC